MLIFNSKALHAFHQWISFLIETCFCLFLNTELFVFETQFINFTDPASKSIHWFLMELIQVIIIPHIFVTKVLHLKLLFYFILWEVGIMGETCTTKTLYHIIIIKITQTKPHYLFFWASLLIILILFCLWKIFSTIKWPTNFI